MNAENLHQRKSIIASIKKLMDIYLKILLALEVEVAYICYKSSNVEKEMNSYKH